MNRQGVLIFMMGVWIVRILMIIIVIAGLALQIRAYVNARVNMDVVEAGLLAQVVGTSTAFLSQDGSGGYQRVIDVERFAAAQEGLNAALAYGRGERHAAAAVVLEELSGQKRKWAIYLNPDYYSTLAAQGARLWGKTVFSMERQWPVTIIEQGREAQGILHVQVLQPV